MNLENKISEHRVSADCIKPAFCSCGVCNGGYMFFYRIEATVNNLDLSETENEGENEKKLRVRYQPFHRQEDKNGTIFPSTIIDNKKVLLGAVARDAQWLDNNFDNFQAASEIDHCITTIEETTFNDFKSMLMQGEFDWYSHRSTGESVFRHFGVNALAGGTSINYSEHMLQKSFSKKKMLKGARDLICAESLVPELERVYQPPIEPVVGHPVHYLIQCDNDYLCDSVYELLLSSLFANNRLGSRKYAVAGMSEINFDKDECRALYEACTHGALVIKCGEKIEGELSPEERLLRAIFGEKYIGPGNEVPDAFWLSTLCQMALEYRDKTLTIFCLPRSSERVKVKMREQLDIVTLVDIAETFISKESAKLYLKQTARNRGITADKSLYSVVRSEQTAFSSAELLRAFDVWYSKRLKNHAYPQYAAFSTSGQISSKTIYSGDAFGELNELIGLDEAKLVIKQAVDYFKAQRLLCDRGLSYYRPSMHMVFTGSPGTAKTTVARLFARILRENELLSVGKLYEVGRADLIGKYVGWTAKKVESIFAEAMGSVLFIDEAYSLVDGCDGSYGDEAISTIVAQMENRRDDIVVIFAGYTEKMEGLLQKNPGLRSRISFHVPFSDYNSSELYQILEYIADKQSLILDDGVKFKVMPILLKAGKEPDFGNGRYARNLIERARMKQAGRLLKMDIDKVTADQATRLLAEDFEALTPTKAAVQQIGFYCA